MFDFKSKRRLRAQHHGSGSPATVMSLVNTLASELGQAAPVAVAVGIEAPIERETGAVAPWASTRLPEWREINIRSILENGLGLPVVVDNDANFDALAEWTWGVGRRADCFLNITCSEGVGSGLIIDGRVHRGSDGMAGQIGHTVVEQDGAVCFCGNRGCLATLISERAIVSALSGSDSPKPDLPAVVQAATKGDPACQRVLFESGRHLGRALCNAAKLLSPRTISIGGLLSGAGTFVLDGLNSSIEVASLRAISPSIEFAIGRLGHRSKLLGGLAAALDVSGQGVSELESWMTLDADPRNHS